MSSSLLVDLAASCQLAPSIVADPALSGGGPYSASGAIIGGFVDLTNANTYCNIYFNGGQSFSGRARVAVQTSDATTSGSFTDPTSGLPRTALPTTLQSGGVLWVNSGAGPLLSGVFVAAAFQRPQRYARLVVLSGDFFAGAINGGFISQLRTTSSGGGSTQLPGSGTPSV